MCRGCPQQSRVQAPHNVGCGMDSLCVHKQSEHPATCMRIMSRCIPSALNWSGHVATRVHVLYQDMPCLLSPWRSKGGRHTSSRCLALHKMTPDVPCAAGLAPPPSSSIKGYSITIQGSCLYKWRLCLFYLRLHTLQAG